MRPQRPRFGRELQALGLAAVGTVLLLGSVFHSLPSNVLSDSGVRSPVREFSIDLAPQGWGFFTRSPSEPDLHFFDAESLESLVVTPQGRAENAFGLSRTQRAQGPEAGTLLFDLTDEDWVPCETGDTLADCRERFESDAEVRTVENGSPVPTLCGSVLFAQSDPVPWSYRDLYEVAHLPQYLTILDVRCET